MKIKLYYVIKNNMKSIKLTDDEKRQRKINYIISRCGNIYNFDKFEYVQSNCVCTLTCRICDQDININISQSVHNQ